MKAIPEFPGCEGRGPQLCAVYINNVRLPGPAIIIHKDGSKIYVVRHGDGCLVLAEDEKIAAAVDLFIGLAVDINAGQIVGESGTELVWAVTKPTADSFTGWVQEVVNRWIQIAD
jgi:hypothetical protein